MRIHSARCTLVTVAASLLAGCSSDNVGAPPPAPVDWHAFDVPRTAASANVGPTEKERAVVDAYLVALGPAGSASLASRLDNEVRFTFPGLPDSRGKAADPATHDPGAVSAHDALFAGFDGRSAVASRVWRTADEQIVEWTVSGTQNGTWMGIPATHKPAVIKGVTLIATKDDGSITKLDVVFDVAVVKAQLGVGPKDLLALPPPVMASGAPQVLEQSNTKDEVFTVTAARAVLDALEHDDPATFAATMTDDVVIETPERAQPMRGKDDVKAYFKTMHKSIGELDSRVAGAWGIGSYAIVEYSVAGEQIGAYDWIPAKSDKVVEAHFVDVSQVRDGKVAHVWRYENPQELVVPQ
jgi:ketosteroid isomerase-like protein